MHIEKLDDTLHGGVIKCSICEEYKSRADYGSQTLASSENVKNVEVIADYNALGEDLLEVQGRK
jgi:hypothetical protein